MIKTDNFLTIARLIRPRYTRVMRRFQILSSLLVTLLVAVTARAVEPSPSPVVSPSPSSSPSSTPTSVPTNSGPISVDHVDKQTIYFSGNSAPKPLKTELHDLVFMSALSPEDGSMPYFLFAANPCADCTSERALYLIRPTTTPQITTFVYPGHVLDGKSHQLILDSRSFYGHCVAAPDHSDQYVVFQRENVDRRHRGLNSVFVAQASNDYLRERLIDHGMPSLHRTLQLVKQKQCKEIAGRSRIMPIKPRGLSWRNLKQQQNDDEDEDSDSDDSTDAQPTGGTE
jgi:hypothetical protein